METQVNLYLLLVLFQKKKYHFQNSSSLTPYSLDLIHVLLNKNMKTVRNFHLA
jgi:hypothetical protein